jgi:hypothetical protein
VAGVVADLKAVLDRRFGVQEYLIWSTVIAALMFVPIRGATFFFGYVIVIFNAIILLAFDRLAIHRNHMLAIVMLTGFSLIGALSSGTPLNAPISQILGISVLSIYFFSALLVLGPSLVDWMEIYMRAAFMIAIIGLVKWVGVHVIQVIHPADPRLTSIYSEPSYFVYVTLPAVGYCLNCYINERRYGRETLVFLLCYMLANSTLGFFGLLLIGLLAYGPRLKGWQMLGGLATACILVVSVYVASGEVRMRANEMVIAIARQDLSGTGATTFAFLSNVYVASQSFLAHPLTGIGLGGYANAYDKYIEDLIGTSNIESLGREFLNSLQLNRDDAASMFLRVAAELGIPGLLVLASFLIVCARVRGAPYATIRNAILPYLIVRMTRMGHYFTVELYFFAGIYLFNYLNYRNTCQIDPAFANNLARPRRQPETKPI